jgi:VPS62-like protein
MSAAVAKLQQQVSIRHAESRPDAAAVAAVASAITNGNYALDGVTFEPFRLRTIADTFDNIWNSDRGDTAITFFRSNGKGGAYLPLGDIALIGSSLGIPTAPGANFLFAPNDDPTVLKNPVGFTWILDDHGSGNSRDIDYFTMNPPAGYTALGIAFNSSGDGPNPKNYWCVRNDLVRSAAAAEVWSDHEQHWKSHNGNLNVPVLNFREPPPEPSMYFVPPTFLSAEGGNQAYALRMQQADLPITPFDPVFPTFDPTITSGDETAYGLTSVKIMPYTAVTDPGVINRSVFYYIAAEPYWLCTQSLSTPAGGEFDVQVTVGTSETNSAGFTSETSMTVSAEVGVEYGAASAKASASYTQSFSTTAEQSDTTSTEYQKTISLNFPAQPRTWVWERQTQISVFRNDTTQLTPVTYSGSDVVFIPGGPTEVK